MKKILVLHIGGTIAMKENMLTGSVSPGVVNPLLDAEITIPEHVELLVEDIFNLPSPHIMPSHMLVLRERILSAYESGILGVVITHGMDTLEETALFLDTTTGDKLPIVLTGAMRSSNELGSDGLYDFESAIRVASCEEAVDKGALVVMNNEIHSARYVTKTHTINVATFRTPTLGPIGLVAKNRILFSQGLLEIKWLDISAVNGIIPIVKAYTGMQGDLLEVTAHMKVDGLVIETLGAGNFPPQALTALEKLPVQKIPVVLVSRCFNGTAGPVYNYEGGGKEPEEMGIIFCNSINSQKARLKLLIAVSYSLMGEELVSLIQD